MLEITKHAEERYVQRVMGYTDKQDIATYIVQNKDLIAERISKMCDHGELIYTGKVKEGNFVNVILMDTWVILTDRKNEKVITLYKVELITDENEFNQLFVDKMKEKLDVIFIELEKAKIVANDTKFDLRDKIEVNKAKIKEFEASINDYKKLNTAYEGYIEAFDADVHEIELRYRTAIEDLVSNKIF